MSNLILNQLGNRMKGEVQFVTCVAVRHALRMSVMLTALNALSQSTVQAQSLFLTSGSITVTDAIYRSNPIYVGVDSEFRRFNPGTGEPYTATANFVSGAEIMSVVAFGTNALNVDGGVFQFAGVTDNATMDIRNGTLSNVSGSSGSSVNIRGGKVRSSSNLDNAELNISGGEMDTVESSGSSKVNFSGGTVDRFFGRESSTTRLSGGTLVGGILLINPESITDFVGSNLSFTYRGSGSENPFLQYADLFTISGSFNNTQTSYDLYIRNQPGSRPVPNELPRQFSFNGVAVAVPEQTSLLYLLIASANLALLTATRVLSRPSACRC